MVLRGACLSRSEESVEESFFERKKQRLKSEQNRDKNIFRKKNGVNTFNIANLFIDAWRSYEEVRVLKVERIT